MGEKTESRNVKWPTLAHTVESGPGPGQELSSLPTNPGPWPGSTLYKGTGTGTYINSKYLFTSFCPGCWPSHTGD